MTTTTRAWAVASLGLLLGIGAGSTAPAAGAQEKPPDAPASQPQQLGTVVVTGSRQKRSAGNSESPIDVVTSADLEKTGAGSLTEALNDILPSFNLPAVTGYDQSAIVRPANLRGLNGDQTLVLVNGKRRHVSGIVNVNAYVNRGSESADLNLIPFAAIDHVEVLRDGASAQYGSDAIAGVINIILKSDPQGFDGSSQVGGYGWKDGLTFHAGASKGFRLGSKGFINIAAEHFSQNPTDRSGPDTGNLSASPTGSFYYPVPHGCMGAACSPDPREATTNPDKVVDGLPFTRTWNIGYNAELPLPGGIDLYSFSTYSFRHAKGYEFFRHASDGAKDPTYNYDPDTDTYQQIYPDGYEPNEVIDENDFSFTGGARGDNLFGWHWDASATYGSDDDSVSVVNTMNATLGPTSPHTFYAGSWVASEFTGNLDFSHPFEIGLKSPLNVAFGAEYRHDIYTLKPGSFGSYGVGPYTQVNGIPTDSNPPQDTNCNPDENSRTTCYFPTPGAQSFPGFNPLIASDSNRDSYAGYVDLEFKPLPKWELGLAGRFEHYDDFGNTTTGKLSTRWQVIDQLALRGTVSNGFRAPGLGQSHYAATTTNFANGVAFQVGTFPVDSNVAEALGATTLRPEKSTNYSIGLVAQPIRAMDITLDLYRIYLRHRVLETSPIGEQQYPGAGIATELEAAGLDANSAAGTSIQYFTNSASTRTQGIDLVSGYRTNFHEYGSVRWSIEANWNQTSITSLGEVPPQLAQVKAAYPDFQLVGPDVQGFLTVGTPRSKLIFGAQYVKGPFRANLHETRFGHIVDTNQLSFGGPVETVPATWITDLDLSYDVTGNLTLGLGANNLFNRYPPHTGSDFQAGGEGFGIYDPLSPYGYFGGFYYGRVTVHFD